MTASSKRRKTAKDNKFEFSEHVCLFVDCQTTGASPANGNLLELAWCTANASGSSYTPLQSYLIRQPEDHPIPPRIQMLTGITAEHLDQAVPHSVLVKELRRSLKRLPEPKLCIIHYARFEQPFLLSLMQEHARMQALPFETVCTFEIARRLYPNLPSRGIKALGGFLGMDMAELKRSSSHVAATVEIWRHLVDCLLEQKISTLSELQEFLASPAVAKRKRLEYPMEKLKRLNLPDVPGVYRMLSASNRVLYVGKATSLRARVNSHFRGRKNKSTKALELLTQVNHVSITECRSPLEAALLEVDEIKRFNPPYNTSLKAGNRALLYFSRQFDAISETQDFLHPIGPFTSSYSIDSIIRLSNTIYSGMLDPF